MAGAGILFRCLNYLADEIIKSYVLLSLQRRWFFFFFLILFNNEIIHHTLPWTSSIRNGARRLLDLFFSFLFALLVLLTYQLPAWKIMVHLKLQRSILNTTEMGSWSTESCPKLLTFTCGPWKIRGKRKPSIHLLQHGHLPQHHPARITSE